MAMNPRLMRPLAKTPPGTPASLLLRFNGANESTTFVDSSPSNNAISYDGNVEISTTQSKFGGSSLRMFGGKVTTPNLLDLAAGDWTIEFWLYASSDQLDKHVVSNVGPANLGINIYLDNGGRLTCNNGTDPTSVGGSFSDYWDTWTHVAVVRRSGSVRMYINGVQAGETSSQTPGTSQYLSIGGSLYEGYNFSGYIDDLRVVPGLAVYQGPFIPRTQQLSAYATPVPVQREAGLLLHFDGDFDDSSPSNITITPNGDATTSTAQSKFGGSSAYFDGDGDYLTGSLEMDHSADFTIEMWIRISSLSGYQCLLEMGDIFTNGGGLQIYFAAADGNTINFGNASTTTIIGTAVSADEWIHVAAVRHDGTSTLYLNGVSAGSLSITFPVNADTFTIGEALGYSQPLNGYIDDLRIVPGLAVYDGDYVVPTAQLSSPASPYTAYKPYGTFLFSECVSGDLVGTYADGVGGRYTEVISAGSC